MRKTPDLLRHLDVHIERSDGERTPSDVKTRIKQMIIMRLARIHVLPFIFSRMAGLAAEM